MIKLTILIKDEETIEAYKNIDHELIEADFVNNPEAWLKSDFEINAEIVEK